MKSWARATVVAGLTLLGQACGKYERNSHAGAAGETTTDARGGASSDAAASASALPRVEGERCDEPNTACHAAFHCEAGVCKQGGLRSLFADACH